MSPRPLAALVASLAIAAAALPAVASAEKVGPPSRVTAIGDSITRGYNSQGVGCTTGDCQQNNWATGTNSAVNSYLTRVQALNPAAVPSNPTRLNDAVSGAKAANMAGPTGQAQTAIAGNPDLVLVEIGANDVCTSSEATMTSLTSFRASMTDAISRLSTQLPNARIVVGSIPNIYNLWDVLKGNATARFVWGFASICQSMLKSPTSTAQIDVDRRNNVRQRNQDFNAILADVCSQYVHCRYDGGAIYGLNFVASDVSTIDFFHPSTNGQKKAAETAWNAGPDYTDLTAPTTTITRDRPADGSDDWYRGDVTVTLSSADADAAGTEYFYKLVGGADQPWTKYTGPVTVSSEGSTEIDARSVDVNGNIESTKTDVVKIDKTAPTFSLACTPSALLNGSATATVSGATDTLSGLQSDPNGSAGLDTSVLGTQSHSVEIADLAGNTASHSCSYDVLYDYSGVLQPINLDGSSVFKAGSTVPVKFHLADANGAAQDAAVARIDVAQVSGDVEGTYLEAVSTAASTTGNLFRGTGDGGYMFNLSTKGMSSGTYSVRITLDDGSKHAVRISLK